MKQPKKKKTRDDSTVDALPANQKEALESWLFEENISYAKAQKRLWEDFSARCSLSALARWYQRKAEDRMLEKIVSSRRTANAVVAKVRQNPADTMNALMEMIGQIAFEKSLAGQQVNTEELFFLTKLLNEHRANQIKSEKITLDRSKFEFDAAKACMKRLPELKQIMADNSLDEDAKMLAFRQKLFGDLPSQ